MNNEVEINTEFLDKFVAWINLWSQFHDFTKMIRFGVKFDICVRLLI